MSKRETVHACSREQTCLGWSEGDTAGGGGQAYGQMMVGGKKPCQHYSHHRLHKMVIGCHSLIIEHNELQSR